MVNYFMSVAKINWLMFVKYSKDLEFAFSYKGMTTFKKTKDKHKKKDFLDINYWWKWASRKSRKGTVAYWNQLSQEPQSKNCTYSFAMLL